MNKEEAIVFLDQQIKGIDEAVARHDAKDADTTHWVSTKEQLLERKKGFEDIKNLINNI